MKTAHHRFAPRMTVVGGLLLAIAGVPGTPAAASDKVLLGGGAGIALDGNLCTLTTIGHNKTGDLIGFTSAHCGGPGVTVAAEGTPATVGSVVASNEALDYAVIKFDPATVTPISDFDGFAIKGIDADPPLLHTPCMERRADGHTPTGQICVDTVYPDQYQMSCQQSRATGRTCGDIVSPGHDPATLQAHECGNPDDSGAPVTVGDMLIGMVRGGFVAGTPCPLPGNEFNPAPKFLQSAEPEIVSINAIIADAAKGGPGAGFVPVSS